MFFCAAVSAQASKIDSLERVLASFGEDSHEKGMLLLRLSDEYETVENDTARSRALIMEAIDMGRKNRLKELETEAYFYAAGFFWGMQQHYKAHVYYKKAEMIAAESDNKPILCAIYFNLSNFSTYYFDHDNVIYYTGRLLETTSEWYDTETLEPKDDISPNVLEKINERFNIKMIMFMAQYFAGLVPFSRNNTSSDSQESLDFHHHMFEKAIRLNIASSRIMNFALQCGIINVNIDRPQEALYYLYYIIEDYESSFSSNKRHSATIAYAMLARAHAMLEQWDLTEYYIGKFTESPPRSVSINARLGYLRARSMFESYKGDHVSALETFKLYHHITDSTRRAGRTTEIARIRMWREFERIEAENQMLQAEMLNNQLKIIAFTTLILMLMALFVLLLYWYYNPFEREQKTEKSGVLAEFNKIIKQKIS